MMVTISAHMKNNSRVTKYSKRIKNPEDVKFADVAKQVILNSIIKTNRKIGVEFVLYPTILDRFDVLFGEMSVLDATMELNIGPWQMPADEDFGVLAEEILYKKDGSVYIKAKCGCRLEIENKNYRMEESWISCNAHRGYMVVDPSKIQWSHSVIMRSYYGIVSTFFVSVTNSKNISIAWRPAYSLAIGRRNFSKEILCKNIMDEKNTHCKVSLLGCGCLRIVLKEKELMFTNTFRVPFLVHVFGDKECECIDHKKYSKEFPYSKKMLMMLKDKDIREILKKYGALKKALKIVSRHI